MHSYQSVSPQHRHSLTVSWSPHDRFRDCIYFLTLPAPFGALRGRLERTGGLPQGEGSVRKVWKGLFTVQPTFQCLGPARLWQVVRPSGRNHWLSRLRVLPCVCAMWEGGRSVAHPLLAVLHHCGLIPTPCPRFSQQHDHHPSHSTLSHCIRQHAHGCSTPCRCGCTGCQARSLWGQYFCCISLVLSCRASPRTTTQSWKCVLLMTVDHSCAMLGSSCAGMRVWSSCPVTRLTDTFTQTQTFPR